MFSDQVEIILYVNNVKESSQFWQTFGFAKKGREEVDSTSVVEIAPSESAKTIIVLYDLAFIQKRSSEMTGNIPPLMFASGDIIGLYKKMQEAGIIVGEMVQLPTGLVSNLIDSGDNYLTMMGQESK